MTVGRFESKDEMETVYNAIKGTAFDFNTKVDRVVIEVIGAHEESITESEIILGA